jgi:hypothetical protein
MLMEAVVVVVAVVILGAITIQGAVVAIPPAPTDALTGLAD